MKYYIVKKGDAIWDVVNLMVYKDFVVLFPVGCYLGRDGFFDVVNEDEEINPYEA